MANLSASKDNLSYSNTKKDLFKIFNDSIDQNVIEMVIEYRDNDLLLAHKDLTEMANTKDTEQNQNCPSNEEEKNSAADATDLKKFNFINWQRLAKCVPPINKILYLVSKGYKVMVIMRGLPGCGKSFQAKNILNQCYTNPNSDEFIFSADKFFINKRSGRYHYNKSKISDAHLWSQQKVKHAVEHGVTPVIIDNTHTQGWEMEIYFKLSVNNGYWIEIIEPTSEWAWETKELCKKNVHNVPYDAIEPMILRYEHNITVEKLLDRFKLKYTKKNEPPQLSKCFEKNQLSEELTRQGVNKNKQNEQSSFEINEHFKDLCVSPKLDNCVEKNDQCISFKYGSEDGDTCVVQQNEMSVFEELDNFADDNQSISSTDEASNYINKSINTCENEFKFLEFLYNPEEELYCSNYIKCIIGKPRDINEGNNYILNTYIGKLDKSTATDDLVGILHKPTLDKLREEFPENICQLLNELFDKCNGNINWISDMLQESGHDYISKQRLYSLIQFKENDFTKSIDLGDNIEKSEKQNNVKIKQDLHRTSLDLQSNTVTFTENKPIQENENKKKRKKKKKKLDLKDNELQTNPNYVNDLIKNIENKFTFDNSLYSEHVLKIKQLKENHNMLDKNDVIPPISEPVDVDVIPEQHNKVKLVELAMDPSVLTQLCDYFGDASSDLNKNKLPMSVKIPEKLAEELYYCLIANVPLGIYDQDKLLIDEIFARKLQEKYDAQRTYSGQITFAEAVRLKNKKIQDDALNEFSGNKIKHSTNQESENSVEFKDSSVNGVKNEHSLIINYNEDELSYAHSRKKYNVKANQSIRYSQHSAVTQYYLDKAEEFKQNENQAKANKLLAFIKLHDEASLLDLHFLSVQDAILTLNLFLDYQISLLRHTNKTHIKNKRLTIITGRGKHSPHGRPCIKPVVEQKIKARNLIYFNQDQDGLIIVLINKNSVCSSK